MKEEKDKRKCEGISRKDFIKKAGKLAIGASVTPWLLNSCSANETEAKAETTVRLEPKEPQVYIAKDSTPAAMTRSTIDALGRMGRFVSKGDKVALVPNIAWSRTPEQAANTNPEVVRTLIEMCFEEDAKQVEVFCHTCSTAKVSYEMSGIGDVVKEAGAFLLFIGHEDDFEQREIPMAIWNSHNGVAKALLSADVFISAPIAKHHGISKLTMLQKNLFGVVHRRDVLHRNIHEEIVALQNKLPADLYVLDCTRILLRNGPQGGNLKDVAEPNIVLAGTDPIAMEAFACTLFQRDPESIPHIKLAHDKGLGTIDWQSVSKFL